MNTDKEISDRYSPLIKSDEVVIVLRKAQDDKKVDFSVLISDKVHADPKVEVDTKVLTAVAVGMTTIASAQMPILAKIGAQTLVAAKDIVNLDDNSPEGERLDVV